MNTYKAAVIGGGLMGALQGHPSDELPKTHAGGYASHDAFELMAICDLQPNPLLDMWQCPIFTDFNEMLDVVKPDVLSVAVPGYDQVEILERLLEYSPRAVIAEKPLSMSLDDSLYLVKAFEDADIPLIVNYSRRFVPVYRELAENFAGKEKVISVVIKYAKGLINNGLHAIDLARLLFGEVVKSLPLSKNYDHDIDDPSISAFLIMERADQLFLIAQDERAYTHFEVDIHTDRSRYLINHDHRKLTIWNVQENMGDPSGLRLVKQSEQDTGHGKAINYLVENLFQVIDKKVIPSCTGHDAVSAQRVAKNLRELTI